MNANAPRGFLIIIWTGLNIKIGIVQKAYAGKESDSLYSAASVLLCGKPNLNLELQASSLISFAKNRPDITDAAKAKGHFEFDYLAEMLNVASLDSSQSIINLVMGN